MDINPVHFAEVTNRESWSQIIELADADTGDDIDLTGYTFACEIRSMPRHARYGDTYGEWYDYPDVRPVIALALGSGITVIDIGKIQLDITIAQMRTLGPGVYSIALTATLDPDTRQIFLGTLPVLYGGVT